MFNPPRLHNPRYYAQGNALVAAAYRMPLDCKRLLLLTMSKLRYDKVGPTREDFTVQITGSDWIEVFGDNGHAYGQLKAAALSLYQTPAGSLWYGYTGAGRARGHRWFDECEYIDGEGKVRLVFSDAVRPNLLDLVQGGDYTKADLILTCRLGTTVATRIYESCRQYRKTLFWSVTLEELRRRLRLDDKYKRWVDLRIKVLEPAVAEICANTEMALTMTYRKKGRAVSGIMFKWKEQEVPPLDSLKRLRRDSMADDVQVNVFGARHCSSNPPF